MKTIDEIEELEYQFNRAKDKYQKACTDEYNTVEKAYKKYTSGKICLRQLIKKLESLDEIDHYTERTLIYNLHKTILKDKEKLKTD